MPFSVHFISVALLVLLRAGVGRRWAAQSARVVICMSLSAAWRIMGAALRLYAAHAFVVVADAIWGIGVGQLLNYTLSTWRLALRLHSHACLMPSG